MLRGIIKEWGSMQSVHEYEELLSPSEIYFEQIMMALRRPQGVCKKILSAHTKQKANQCIEQGWLHDYGTTIGYTDRGFLIENKILTQLI